jgi:crotonobetainyl-CoA:carnitine CoA-transferase CaiB-like acyl-CoA transferase
LYAFSGEMYTMGMTDREPVKMAGTAACFESGASIAAALMGTLWASKKHGIGQHVDISLSETHFGGVDRRHATAIAYQFSGRKTLRAASTGAGTPNGIYPCADGYMDFTNASLRYDRVVEMLGNPEWATDPKYMDPVSRLDPNIIEEWTANFLMWCVERTKREVWAEGRRAKVLCGPLFTMQDLFEDEHFGDVASGTKSSTGTWESHHPAAPSRWREGMGDPANGAAPRRHTVEVLKEAACQKVISRPSARRGLGHEQQTARRGEGDRPVCRVGGPIRHDDRRSLGAGDQARTVRLPADDREPSRDRRSSCWTGPMRGVGAAGERPRGTPVELQPDIRQPLSQQEELYG